MLKQPTQINKEFTMKKSLIFTALFVPATVIAAITAPEGFPEIGSGVTVAPAPKNEAFVIKLNELKVKGYDETVSDRGAALFSLNVKAKKEISDYRFYKNPEDSHLKEKISDIHLAFDVKPLSFITPENLFGYAAVGMYKQQQGWTGITMFFKDKDLGVCAYTLNNMKISEEAVQLFEEFVRHDINDMPNVIYNEGTKNSGFLYKINWFDKTFEKKLECFNKKPFNKEITNQLINLAQHIEKDAQ